MIPLDFLPCSQFTLFSLKEHWGHRGENCECRLSVSEDAKLIDYVVLQNYGMNRATVVFYFTGPTMGQSYSELAVSYFSVTIFIPFHHLAFSPDALPRPNHAYLSRHHRNPLSFHITLISETSCLYDDLYFEQLIEHAEMSIRCSLSFRCSLSGLLFLHHHHSHRPCACSRSDIRRHHNHYRRSKNHHHNSRSHDTYFWHIFCCYLV